MTSPTIQQPDEPTRLRKVLQRREARIGFFFVLPAFILFVLFRFAPAIAGIALSLFNYNIISAPTWAGLSNFAHLVNDPDFYQALGVTLLYAVITVPLCIVVSTVMALGVRRGFRGSRFFRSIFFLPVITSVVLASSIFIWIFSTNGPWSALMSLVGLGGSWLASSTLVIPALAVIGTWSRFGFDMLILIAAMQGIPREIEEAALMDGARAPSRFRYVVLPELRPAIFFLVVIETTNAFQIFDPIYAITGGGPGASSTSLVYLLYNQGFVISNYGYASAIGVVLLVLTLVIALIQRAFLGRQK